MSKIESETKVKYNAESNSTISDETYIRTALNILRKRIRKPDTYATSPKDVINYLELKLCVLEREVFAVLFTDTQNGITNYEELFVGTINGAAIYPREIVKRALELNAKSIILAHNHPSGNVEPSRADIEITKRIKEVCSLVEIDILDHIIIGDGSYSLSEHGDM